MLYTAGTSNNRCTPFFPIFIRHHELCALDIPAKSFPGYTPWSLALLLKKKNKDLLVFPSPLFIASQEAWPTVGSACHRFEHLRHFLTPDVAASLRKDPQFTFLHSLIPQRFHLAALSDSSLGNPNSWVFGHGPNSDGILDFQSFQEDGATVWGCALGKGTARQPYPFFNGNLLHPCVDRVNLGCCGAVASAAFAVFRSWFSLEQVTVELKVSACLSCGDGIGMEFYHETEDGLQRHMLLKEAFHPTENGPCQVRHLRLTLDIKLGDHLVFGVFPNTNMLAGQGQDQDCDGVYIEKWSIWKN